MSVLKSNMTEIEYDNVRYALGLEPIRVAAQKGKEITENVRETLDQSK